MRLEGRMWGYHPPPDLFWGLEVCSRVCVEYSFNLVGLLLLLIKCLECPPGVGGIGSVSTSPQSSQFRLISHIPSHPNASLTLLSHLPRPFPQSPPSPPLLRMRLEGRNDVGVSSSS